MSMIQTENAGLLGPFLSIEVLEDKVVADGALFFNVVIGAFSIVDHDPPGPAHLYSWDGEAFNLLPLSDEVRGLAAADKWEKIKAFRDDRLLNGGYPVDGHWYYSDLIARSQHLGNARKADRVEFQGGDMSANLVNLNGTPVVVKSMNNGYMAITATRAHEIMDAAEVQEMTTYAAALAHKAAMEASEDPANYDFRSSGWPEIYVAP